MRDIDTSNCLYFSSKRLLKHIDNMAPPTNRKEILQGLRDQIAKGQAVVGGGAGVGLSAKFAEAGGYELSSRICGLKGNGYNPWVTVLRNN